MWDAVGSGRVDFEGGDDAIAHIVENNVLQSSIIQAMKVAFNEVALYNKTAVSKIEMVADNITTHGSDYAGGGVRWPTLHLDNGHILQARLLVSIE